MELSTKCSTLLEGEATRSSVAMRTDLSAELPKIMVDRVQLQQVFMNLMLNAIEAMKDSGGELTVKSRLQDGQLQFSVSDTGVGLPTEKMDQIFSAFFTTKPQGSGMGLAISRSIVESHGGQLWASANSGAGRNFSFHPTDPGHGVIALGCLRCFGPLLSSIFPLIRPPSLILKFLPIVASGLHHFISRLYV